MDWIDSLNKALDMIENHLTDEIDYDELSAITQCPIYYFQKIFLYMSGLSLNEYIRLRKLSLAAVDLQKNNVRVIDAALKYGYNSPTAFNRAFKKFHGIAPSLVKNGNPSIKSYPPLRFSLAKHGGCELKLRIEHKPAFRLLGLSCPLDKCLENNFKSIPNEWDKAVESGKLMELMQMNDLEPKGVLGVSDHHSPEWKYMIAAASSQSHSDFEACVIPEGMWAVFTGRGTNVSLQNLERQVIMEWLPTSGYRCADRPDIEYYIQANPMDAIYEYWLPIQ